MTSTLTLPNPSDVKIYDVDGWVSVSYFVSPSALASFRNRFGNFAKSEGGMTYNACKLGCSGCYNLGPKEEKVAVSLCNPGRVVMAGRNRLEIKEVKNILERFGLEARADVDELLEKNAVSMPNVIRSD